MCGMALRPASVALASKSWAGTRRRAFRLNNGNCACYLLTMPDFLLELFSEEIPARMQARAAEDLRKRVTDALVGAGLVYEGAKAFVTPRRLALAVKGVPVRQPDVKEEKKGPRVSAPESAIQGFLCAAGLNSIGDAKIVPDKRGDFYVAVIEKEGRPAIDVLAEIVPEVVKTFPWPKSMRWGEQSQQPGSLAWVRPLHSIVATFGPETEEPEIVPFAIDGIKAGDETHGHRFMAPQPFKVRRFEDYAAKLEKAKVVLDPDRRKEMILADAKNLAFAQGYELVEDAGLLAEIAGLVEWPVVLMGSFDDAFLRMPPEIVRATIRNNQKCFVLREERTSQLADKFILVANIEAEDGGKAIVAGNERVIRARLADAKFFYDTNLKTRLEERLSKFKDIVFHEKLGTQWERIERIERLAAELAPKVGADVEKTRRAARLAKADLLTEVVGEFPELQGVMGKYYALAQGEDPSVEAAAERVAGAIKAFDENKDMVPGWEGLGEDNAAALLLFIADRLKVQLREQGARHDLVDAVFALEGQDDLVLIVRRVDALGKFLETDDGSNLLIGYRRAANILRDEEKKDRTTYSGAPNHELMRDPIEQHLWRTIQSTAADANHHVAREDFESAMETLSTLRNAVDDFFASVTVNVEDKQLRENRLKLLNEIREATRTVADFSRIEG